jgi:hypothetical protein
MSFAEKLPLLAQAAEKKSYQNYLLVEKTFGDLPKV